MVAQCFVMCFKYKQKSALKKTDTRLKLHLLEKCQNFQFQLEWKCWLGNEHTLNALFSTLYLYFYLSNFQVPSYMSEFVMVTAWVQDNGMHLYPNTDIGGKYNVIANGELYINNASPSDGFKTYTCRTINRLTGKVAGCLFFFWVKWSWLSFFLFIYTSCESICIFH